MVAGAEAVPVNDMGEVKDKNVRCSLVRTPGIATFVELPLAPVRGLFPGEHRLFAVGGDHFYEILSDGTIIDRSIPGFSNASGVGAAGGTIGNDGLPVQCELNGTRHSSSRPAEPTAITAMVLCLSNSLTRYRTW